MPAFINSVSFGHAIALVTAALQSGALKLHGPTVSHIQNPAEVDAKYLNEVINALAKNLTTGG